MYGAAPADVWFLKQYFVANSSKIVREHLAKPDRIFLPSPLKKWATIRRFAEVLNLPVYWWKFQSGYFCGLQIN